MLQKPKPKNIFRIISGILIGIFLIYIGIYNSVIKLNIKSENSQVE